MSLSRGSKVQHCTEDEVKLFNPKMSLRIFSEEETGFVGKWVRQVVEWNKEMLWLLSAFLKRDYKFFFRYKSPIEPSFSSSNPAERKMGFRWNNNEFSDEIAARPSSSLTCPELSINPGRSVRHDGLDLKELFDIVVPANDRESQTAGWLD